MAGFHHGDPIHPANGANGWIDEEEENKEPIEEEEEEPMEEEEEEPMEEEDEEPMEAKEEGFGPESEDEDSDEEVDIGEVVDGPHPTRIRGLPHPPPAFQNQAPPPRWAAQLHGWSRELGLRPPYGMSRAYFDLSEGTSADRALPVLVGQVSRMDAQVRAIGRQLIEVGAEERVTAVRVRRIDEQQDRHHDLIESLRRDHAAMAARLLSFEERMVAGEQRARTAEALAAAAETRAVAAEARATQAEQRAATLTRNARGANHRGYYRNRRG